jgi:uncharacterized membrane protein YhaH (DUF805 family)
MTTTNPYAAPKANLETPGAGGIDTTSPFSPKGRFARSTYIVYSFGITLLLWLVMFALAGTGFLTGDFSNVGGGLVAVLFWVLYVAALVIGVIFTVRRFHDLNWSGWWTVAMFVPLVNIVVIIPLLFFRGTKGANKYGPPRPGTRTQAILATVLFLVFFVGIIAAVSIPAYVEYTKRAQEQAQQAPATDPTQQ